MFYARDEAKEKIDLILKNSKPIKTGSTLPIRRGMKFNTYQIDIEYLVPNRLNDRISWRILEYQAENNRELSLENEQDVEYIYSLIEKESPNENDNTKKDLAEKGQQVDGIITNKGIIIDGNRRATLLRKLFYGDAKKYGKSVEDFRYFNAIVLTEDINDSEIMALETQIQIGEDKKVVYNPICMYIKVDNLSKIYNEKQIASYMNIKENEVEQRKEIFGLMNEYLESIGKPNHYSLLEGLEDHFINTKTVFKRMDTSTYQTDDWEYQDEDVADFKQVCFDYMRAKFEGKEYRDILVGKPNKTDGVFIKEQVWRDFYKNHENIVGKANPQNESDWQNLRSKFESNLKDASKKLQETIDDKTISETIKVIEGKMRTLKQLLDNKAELSDEDVEKIKKLSKDFYKIASYFK